MRKKRKFEKVDEYIKRKRVKETQKKTKAMLKKAQEEIKKIIDKKYGKAEEYKVKEIVLLSTKNLKFQIIG